MSNMCIEVELLAGTSIEEAAKEAIEKAIKFDVAYIKFDFNGVKMSVGQRATVENVVKGFHEGLGGKYKFAVVNS